MRFRDCGLVCGVCFVLLMGCRDARAQLLSVYGTAAGVHSSGVQVSSAGTAIGGWSPNFGGGVTFNFLNLPVVKLGVDARGSGGAGTTKTSTAELSLRAGFDPPVINLKPWVQVGVGYAAAQVPIVSGVSATHTGEYVTVGGHAGLDRSVLPLLDWRVVDIGVAHGHDLGPGFASGRSNQGANFFSVGTGLLVRF